MRAENVSRGAGARQGPRFLGTPHPVLRALLERDYAGFTHAPRHSDINTGRAGARCSFACWQSWRRGPRQLRFARKGSSVSVSSATT